MAAIADGNVWERMEESVLTVRRRLVKASAALTEAKVPFAIVGGNAVAAWVATVDESAVRNTRDVDIMLRRDDLARAITVMEAAGFTYRHVAQMDIFLDEPNGKALDGVNVIFAGELVNPTNPVPNPDLDTVAILNDIPVIPLFELVKIKLTA